MLFREAIVSDIDGMHRVRMAVKENILPDASMITRHDYEDYMLRRGKGWVCVADDEITGFAIVDLEDANIWALFVDPLYESRGIGKQLHDMMLEWYFSQTKTTVWLGTSPATRAEQFYRKCGWLQTGIRRNGEIRFEMPFDTWQSIYTHQIKPI